MKPMRHKIQKHCETRTAIFNFLLPADGTLARDDVTFSIIETKILLHLTDALTWQAIHTQISSVAHTLCFT